MEAPAPEYIDEPIGPPRRIKNPIIRFIGGLKLGLTVLAAIAIASTIGEFLPFEDSQLSLKLVFHTWWFRLLLITQGVNLTVNTIMTYVDETRPQFQPHFRSKPDNFKPLKINHKKSFKKTKAKDSKSLMASLSNAFARHGYTGYFNKNSFYGHRGLLARFGSTVTHIGLITIIGGALVESYFKEEGMLSLMEEQTDSKLFMQEGQQKLQDGTIDREKIDDYMKDIGFEVRLDDFEFKTYPGIETAQKFKSTVTFRPETAEAEHTYVRVNHDVTYGGWTFHQSSYELREKGQSPFDRYFVNIAETTPEGGKKLHRMEIYLLPRGREIKPIPGHANLFFSLENDPWDSRNLIWHISTKEKVVARGRVPVMDYEIELLQFVPDFFEAQGMEARPGREPYPMAMIEVSTNNEVAWRDWAFAQGKKPPMMADQGQDLDIVITDVQSEGADQRVTVGFVGSDGNVGMSYDLGIGERRSLAGNEDDPFAIPGDYELDSIHWIPTLVSHMSVSKNPGIPIVWLGAIFASFGPFIAFFVSRRRVWAYVDWEGKNIHFGGDSRYSREALQEEISEVVSEWSKSDDAKVEPELKLPRPKEIPKLSQDL